MVHLPNFLSYENVFDWLDLFILQSKTGALEGPEVDGFVKDMMELVQVIS